MQNAALESAHIEFVRSAGHTEVKRLYLDPSKLSDESRIEGGQTPVRIALDAMGGDGAPDAVIEGIRTFCEGPKPENISLIAVGPKDYLEPRLREFDSVEVFHAPDVIGMEESPAVACRTKKKSTIMVMAKMVADGAADGAVSMGNSGAIMASALLTCGRLPKVQRPAIAIPMPSFHGWAILIDSGANSGAKPSHLGQFAIMGETYARRVLNIPRPRVGLLSIGEEEGKGNPLVTETLGLLKNASIHFVGNVEGRDLFNGRADVIVCDGFVGNVLLKGSEGLAEMIFTLLREELTRGFASRIGALLCKKAFKNFYKRLDYTEQGSAPLLGVKGVFMIGHGKSPPSAVANAVLTAAKVVREKINDEIQDAISKAQGLSSIGLGRG